MGFLSVRIVLPSCESSPQSHGPSEDWSNYFWITVGIILLGCGIVVCYFAFGISDESLPASIGLFIFGAICAAGGGPIS